MSLGDAHLDLASRILTSTRPLGRSGLSQAREAATIFIAMNFATSIVGLKVANVALDDLLGPEELVVLRELELRIDRTLPEWPTAEDMLELSFFAVALPDLLSDWLRRRELPNRMDNEGMSE